MLNRAYETPALIATAISRGDKKAEAVLFQKYYRPTLFILERKTRDSELAQDLCQEAFCIMLERLRTQPLSDPDKLAAYLHNIAINLHIAEVRKSGRRKTHTDQALMAVIVDASQNQYRTLLKERSSLAVRRLIAAMANVRDQKLLYGYYIQERDKADICQELDLSLRHFDKVLFRAKQRFRELITQNKDASTEQ